LAFVETLLSLDQEFSIILLVGRVSLLGCLAGQLMNKI